MKALSTKRHHSATTSYGNADVKTDHETSFDTIHFIAECSLLPPPPPPPLKKKKSLEKHSFNELENILEKSHNFAKMFNKNNMKVS